MAKSCSSGGTVSVHRPPTQSRLTPIIVADPGYNISLMGQTSTDVRLDLLSLSDVAASRLVVGSAGGQDVDAGVASQWPASGQQQVGEWGL